MASKRAAELSSCQASLSDATAKAAAADGAQLELDALRAEVAVHSAALDEAASKTTALEGAQAELRSAAERAQRELQVVGSAHAGHTHT